MHLVGVFASLIDFSLLIKIYNNFKLRDYMSEYIFFLIRISKLMGEREREESKRKKPTSLN